MTQTLANGWRVLQDVHDSGERLGLYRDAVQLDVLGAELSEWTPIDRLVHLQLELSGTPYWGRELRHFNQAPWWYRNEFDVAQTALGALTFLRFEHADYYASVWLNGEFLGTHEGYALPFEFDVSDVIRPGANVLHVRVSSPWDEKVAAGDDGRRFAQIVRGMAKGTYEHDDGFIQRDVNPIGLYGAVAVRFSPRIRVRRPRVSYEWDSPAQVRVRVTGAIDAVGPAADQVTLTISDPDGAVVGTATSAVAPDTTYGETLVVTDVRRWETWDRGEQPLYTVQVACGGEAESVRTGFRSIEMVRTEDETTLVLNGHPLFVRGSNYFSDAYLSSVDEARYRRDLEAARRAGINLLRIHVHTERPVFYELCDELGIGLMQESDFNWMHPTSPAWSERLVKIFSDTVELLLPSPSVLLWSCMNEPAAEPGAADADLHAFFKDVRPGPQLVGVLRSQDPSRPYIRSSGTVSDADSGDSHTFFGSLHGEDTHYTDIDGHVEFFNSEFGMDAPGDAKNLRATGRLFERIGALAPLIPAIQHYQYRFLKYYIDHYRVQKFRPCSGYMQFTLTDLAPTSFYGVIDWWGDPKAGYRALEESNQPVAVILEQTAGRTRAVWLVNDTLQELADVEVSWRVTSADGDVVAEGADIVSCPANGGVAVTSLEFDASKGHIDVELRALIAGGQAAVNRYVDVFGHPIHPAGHPTRISHEFGVRLFSA